MKLEDLHPDILYQAILQDEDNQLRANGGVRVYKSEGCGMFVPRDATIPRTIQASSATIEIPQFDLKLKVHNLKACTSYPHFHFDLS